MLMWQWNEKVGEITLYQKYHEEGKEFAIDLYKGNAFLIAIDRKSKNLYTFFHDAEHMKRCLGIDKKWKATYGVNSYDEDFDRWTEIVLYKDKYPEYKKVVPIVAEAFREIDIKVMNKPEENEEVNVNE